jgi:3-dehydroquinate dehydratase / shikimate dehydrogenase
VKPTRNICLVLTTPRIQDWRRKVVDPPDGVDAFELRLDLLDESDRSPEEVASVVRAAARPVIATCRPEAEGGRFQGDDAARERLLGAALAAGAAWVDVEWSWWQRDPELATRLPLEQVQLSHHGRMGSGPELDEIRTRMFGTRAGALKLVARAETFEEAVRFLDLAAGTRELGRKLTCFALGPGGRVSRILAGLRGSYFTYVTEGGDASHLPDLLTLDEAVSIYRLGEQSDSVKLLGILGYPLEHSLSPRMHNRVIRTLGERYVYVPFESPEPGPVIEFVRRNRVRGLSVTAPHKISVMPFLDGLDASARDAGAVNTVVVRGSMLIGHNTDLLAARGILNEWAAGPATRAVVLGAGGAARAWVRALAERRAPTVVLNRDPGRGAATAGEFGAGYGGGLDLLPDQEFSILVNATPLGFQGESLPRVPRLAGNVSLIDLAYRPGGTPLERTARAAGCRVIGGLEFLARQGTCQFALWTRRIVNVDLFREAAGCHDAH